MRKSKSRSSLDYDRRRIELLKLRAMKGKLSPGHASELCSLQRNKGKEVSAIRKRMFSKFQKP